MAKTMRIEDLAQIRVLAMPLRLQILQQMREPRTVKQIADALGLVPAKVHYHVKALERVGLVRLVETREKSGILEKYYQPVAEEFEVDQEILTGTAEHLQAKKGISRTLRAVANEIIQKIEELPKDHTAVAGGNLSSLMLTKDEAEELMKRIGAFIKEKNGGKETPGSEEYLLLTLMSPNRKPVGGLPCDPDDPGGQ